MRIVKAIAIIPLGIVLGLVFPLVLMGIAFKEDRWPWEIVKTALPQ